MSDVKVKITADNSGLATGLQKAKGDVDKFAKETEGAMSGLGNKIKGLFAIGAMVAAVTSALDFADALDETAQALDMNRESLQGLQGAFSKSGVNASQFRSGMSELNKSLQEARDNTGTARESFDALGIQWSQIRDKSPEQILYLIAEGMKNAQDPTKALVASMDLLGKSGKLMATELRGGGDAMREHADGITKLKEDEVKALAALKDAWDDVWISAKTYLGKGVLTVKSIFTGGDIERVDDDIIQGKRNFGSPSKAALMGRSISGQPGKADPRAAKQIEDAAKEAMETMRKQQQISDAIADGELDRAAKLRETLEKEQAITAEKEKQALLQQKSAIEDAKGKVDAAIEDNHQRRVDDILKSPDQKREERRAEAKRQRAENRAERLERGEGVATEPGAKGRMDSFKELKSLQEKMGKSLEEINKTIKAKLGTA